MPVEFLTDDEAAVYGRYAGPPSQVDLDRVFFLDDEDLELVGRHRGEHMRAGFAGFTTRLPLRTRAELTDFVEHLPTQRVATALKYHYVKQAATTWKINHLRDIEALSVAIPYTDAVVTDADVADVATRRARLDAEFGTPVFKNLTELAAYLGL